MRYSRQHSTICNALTDAGWLAGVGAKRGVDARFVDFSAAPVRAGGDTWRQQAAIQAGIGAEDAKRLQALIKQNKLKVQAAIQGDTLRVSGTKKDELQVAMALLRREAGTLPLSFKNFRD